VGLVKDSPVLCLQAQGLGLHQSRRVYDLEVDVSNDPKLMDSLRSTVRKAEQALRGAAQGRPDYNAQADAINKLVEVITQLDARIVVLEEQLNNQP